VPFSGTVRAYFPYLHHPQEMSILMALTIASPLITAPPAYCLRSVTSRDVQKLVDFRTGLLPDTIYNRYFAPIRLSHAALTEWAEHLISRHPCRQLSWVATESNRIVALLELVPDPIDQWHAEMGIVVSDSHQRRGIGTALGRYALEAARRLGIQQVSACMLAENRGAQKFIRKLGTTCAWQDDSDLRIVTMTMNGS
jgi:acetyltransferase